MQTFKVRRLSHKAKERIVRGLKRSWAPGGTHDLLFRGREPDFETERKRFLWDRKGSLFAEIRLANESFCAYWSVLGRTDQVDVFHQGNKLISCSVNRIFKEIESLSILQSNAEKSSARPTVQSEARAD